MRITDDRYTRDRLRFDLAFRLIRHEARTGTIRDWTTLSDDRIRKLCKSYVQATSAERIRRHRGKAPRRAAFFLRNGELRLQSAILASFLCQFGLLHDTEPRKPGSLEQLQWAESFCQAYEAFLQECQQPQIGFEHACCLLQALLRRRDICTGFCAECGSLVVLAAFAMRPAACSFCGGTAIAN